MNKKFWTVNAVFGVFTLFAVTNCVCAYFVNKALFITLLIAQLAIIIFTLFYILNVRKHKTDLLVDISSSLNPSSAIVLDTFPIPAVVTDEKGNILWYNTLFKNNILESVNLKLEKDILDSDIKSIISDFKPDFTSRISGFDVNIGNMKFTAFASNFRRNNMNYYTYYFVDDTDKKRIIEEYYLSKPCVVLVCIDNLEESFQDIKDSEKIKILSDIENILESFITQTNGFLRKLDRDRFLAIIEERHISTIIDKRFSILDEVRAINTFGKVPVTISIGVGKNGKDMAENELFARQALDMALGRGGDQASVKDENGYEFFGGVSKGVEKRSKIKTRIIAAAISELIEAASNVIVMGHRAADLDCLASSAALARCAKEFGKPTLLAIRNDENLAGTLYKRLYSEGYDNVFIHPDEALKQVNDNTLLIITDTHNTKSIESPQLLAACKNVIVVDHHRKMVNYIEKAVIFYHEPYASSASEMVAELSQYIGSTNFLRTVEAEALLAGMMLDTKNFSMKTGVRTFEAAAYLRKLGADTTEVKKMFANSMDVYRTKTAFVAAAEIYKNCAISLSDEDIDNIILISAQAADDLLNINGVDASFVIFKNSNAVQISARSMGKINVQLIMEELEGGGHQTMAGTKIFDADINLVRQRLISVIDTYLKNNNIQP